MSFFFTADSNGAGVRASLDANAESAFIAKGVTVASTNDTAIRGFYSYHQVIVEGTVGADGIAINLGDDGEFDTGQVVKVRAGGQVIGFSATGVNIYGYKSLIENAGTIYGSGQAILIVGNNAGTATTIRNSGTIESGGVGINRAISTEKLIVLNSGTISGIDASFDGQNGFSTSIDQITNNGTMIGDVLLGQGADLYDGRLGHVQGRIDGGAGADTLYGGTDDDALDGGSEADIMSGGLGDDTYYVDNAADQVREAAGQGADTVQSSISYTLSDNVENLTLAGSAVINGTGNALANIITGNGSANTLNGLAGADTMEGLGGNDAYYVDNAADIVIEATGGGSDRVYATVTYALASGIEVEALYVQTSTSTAAVNLTGNEFNQMVQANAGVNVLAGGGGSDSLLGLLGNDTLTGGAGNDSFFFNTALGAANLDHITDFANVSGNNDVIRLDKTIFTGLGTSGLVAGISFAANGGGTANANTQAQIIYNTTTGALVYDSNGSTAGGATQFAAIDNFAGLTGGQAISVADFIVY